MHRLFENIVAKVSIAPQSLTSAVLSGTAIDCKGYNAASVLISVGALTNTKTLDVKVQESDDNTTFADVTGAAITQLIGGASAKNANYAIEMDLTPRNLHIKPIATAGAGATATLSVNVLLHRSEASPADATAAGLSERVQV